MPTWWPQLDLLLNYTAHTQISNLTNQGHAVMLSTFNTTNVFQTLF